MRGINVFCLSHTGYVWYFGKGAQAKKQQTVPIIDTGNSNKSTREMPCPCKAFGMVVDHKY